MADDPSPPDGPGESVEDLYEHAPCGFLSTRPDGTILRINATLLGWLGYDRAELVGRRTFQSLLSVGGRVYYETHYAPMLSMQGEAREIAVDLVRRDGSRLPALVNSDVRPAGPDGSSVVRTTVFGATFRRRYETELLEARRVAERSERLLAQLQELVADFAVALTRADVAAVLVRKGPAVARAKTCAVWLRSSGGADGGAADPTAGAPAWERVGPDDPAPHRTPDDAAPDDAAPPAWAAEQPDPVLDGNVLYVRLSATDEVLGIAVFEFADAGRLDLDIRQLLRTVGRQAGQTLQRTRLFEVETMLRGRAEALQRITSALAVALEPRQIADVAAEQIEAALRVDRILIVLSDPGLSIAVATGFAPELVDSWRRDPAALAAVLEPGGPAVADGLTVLPWRAGPLPSGGLVLGRRRTFSPGEHGFLRLFAAQCAQALERAALSADVAERQKEAAFLVELSRRLDETPGLRRRAAELVAALVPAVVGRARVEFVLDGRLERLASNPDPPAPAGPRPDREERAAAHVTAALNTGVPAPAADEIALPLRARGRVIGVLVVGATRTDRLLSELAESVGLALENGRLYDQERRNALVLQRGLLAGDPPSDPRAAITTWYRPAGSDLEVGGDWYDAFLVGPDRLAVVVGDVVGRGIRAAATMGHLRSAVRALAATDPGPVGVLERLDRFADRFEDGRMSTVAYGVLDLATGLLRYACAGHVPPVLIGPDGRGGLLWGGRSAPVAAYDGMADRVEEQVVLAPGARLLLYTDGLVERRTGNIQDDLDRLATEATGRLATPLAWFLPDLGDAMLDGQRHDDDVCMLCVSFGAGPRFARTVPADVARLKSVRDDLRVWLEGRTPAEADRDALVLACSEAVANAIEHGYRNDGRGVIEVTAVASPDAVELTVRDTGGWREPVPRDERGRGLTVIGSLVDELTVGRTRGDGAGAGGTTVAMIRRLRGRPGGRR